MYLYLLSHAAAATSYMGFIMEQFNYEGMLGNFTLHF